MTKLEVANLIALNQSNYPNSYKNMMPYEVEKLAESWYEILKGYDSKNIMAAFAISLTKSEFPITLANIFAEIKTKQKSVLPTSDELFDMADKAGQKINNLYHPDIGWENTYNYETGKRESTGFTKATAIYNALPAILREWKHSPLELMRWQDAITDENESYIRHEFKEIMSNRMERRETLGIGFNQEFAPRWDSTLGRMTPPPSLGNCDNCLSIGQKDENYGRATK